MATNGNEFNFENYWNSLPSYRESERATAQTVFNDVAKHFRSLMTKHGICEQCGELYSHWLEEPMASCNCRQSEWSHLTPFMLLEKRCKDLYKQIENLQKEIQFEHNSEVSDLLTFTKRVIKFRDKHKGTPTDTDCWYIGLDSGTGYAYAYQSPISDLVEIPMKQEVAELFCTKWNLLENFLED